MSKYSIAQHTLQRVHAHVHALVDYGILEKYSTFHNYVKYFKMEKIYVNACIWQFKCVL